MLCTQCQFVFCHTYPSHGVAILGHLPYNGLDPRIPGEVVGVLDVFGPIATPWIEVTKKAG